MYKRLLLVAAAIAILLVVVPILIAQVTPDETRTLQGVELGDTTYQEITFPNATQGINLAGMLFLPEGDGPFPAVVVIHGAGTSRRDNSWYLTFVSYLQDQGIAVLLPDKRGSEASEGDWRTSSFQDLATDTLAAISYLQTQHPEMISDIGVLGASQGGQIAPIVASQSDDVSFVINAVGSAVPFREALLYEENNNLRELGLLPGLSNAIAYPSTFYIRNIAQRDFWGAVRDWDPLPYWRDVNVPALVLYGETDSNVPSQASADRLRALGNPNLQVIVFEASGHPLEDPEGKGNSYIRRDALELMRDFILEATTKDVILDATTASPTDTATPAPLPTRSPAPLPTPSPTSSAEGSETTPIPGDRWSELLLKTPYPYSKPLPPPNPTVLDGTYTKLDPRQGDHIPCRRCPAYPPGGGIWKLHLDKGVFRVYHELTDWVTLGSFTVSGHRVEFFNDPHCLQDTGIYTWELVDGKLTLTPVEDNCGVYLRARNFEALPWESCQPPSTETAITSHWPVPAGCESD